MEGRPRAGAIILCQRYDHSCANSTGPPRRQPALAHPPSSPLYGIDVHMGVAALELTVHIASCREVCCNGKDASGCNSGEARSGGSGSRFESFTAAFCLEFRLPLRFFLSTEPLGRPRFPLGSKVWCTAPTGRWVPPSPLNSSTSVCAWKSVATGRTPSAAMRGTLGASVAAADSGPITTGWLLKPDTHVSNADIAAARILNGFKGLIRRLTISTCGDLAIEGVGSLLQICLACAALRFGRMGSG
jgi:hypothetical protein